MLFTLSRGAVDCAVVHAASIFSAFCTAINNIAAPPDDNRPWKSKNDETYVWRGTDGTMWFLNEDLEATYEGQLWDTAMYQHDMRCYAQMSEEEM